MIEEEEELGPESYATIQRYTSDVRPSFSLDPIYPLLTLIILLGGFLRFWQINGLFHFMGDEGTQTAAEWHLIHGHFPLLGPSLSIGSMHLGPLFYYLVAVPLWLSGGSPIGPTIFIGIAGLATVALMFFYLRPALGEYPALAAAAVTATSFLMLEYSRRPWNPTLTPFFTMLFFLALSRWRRGSGYWLVLAAVSLGALLQLQPVNIFLVAAGAIFVLLARPTKPSINAIGLSIFLFVLISLPLIIYDAGHHLANSRAWFDSLVGGKSTAAPSHGPSIRLLFNLFNRSFELRVVVISLAFTFLLVMAGIVSAMSTPYRPPWSRQRLTRQSPGEREANWEILLPLLLVVVAVIGFEVYRKEVFEQYMVCLFVVPFMFFGALVQQLLRIRWGALAAGILTTAVVAVGIRDAWSYLYLNPKTTVADVSVTKADLEPDDTYAHVVKVDKLLVRWAAGRPFDIRMASYRNIDSAYRYVLARLGQPVIPSASLTFLLIEPTAWPRSEWPKMARRDASRAIRSKNLGIVRIYELRR